MFLDEELEQIHAQKDKDEKEKFTSMLQAMVRRMPTEQELPALTPGDFLNVIKQIDNGWRLFCKRHSNEYNANGWRNWVLKSDIEGKISKALGWGGK